MVPGALFKGQRIVALAYATAFVGGMFFYSALNFLPLTWADVYPNDPIQVGLKGLPPAISTTVGAIVFNAALSTFPKNTREVLLTAAVIMTVFGGSLAVMTPDNPKTTVALATVACLGLGGMIVPTASVALLVAPDALITTATALSLSVRTVGGAIGYSIYYNVFVTKLKKVLPTTVAAYAIQVLKPHPSPFLLFPLRATNTLPQAGLPLADAEVFVGTLLLEPTKIASVPGFTPQILAAAQVGVRWAYAMSLHYVWYTSIAFGVCAIVCCVFLPSTAKYQTNRVAVAL